jgi:hypothetical protein
MIRNAAARAPDGNRPNVWLAVVNFEQAKLTLIFDVTFKT